MFALSLEAYHTWWYFLGIFAFAAIIAAVVNIGVGYEKDQGWRVFGGVLTLVLTVVVLVTFATVVRWQSDSDRCVEEGKYWLATNEHVRVEDGRVVEIDDHHCAEFVKVPVTIP